jgi:integrase
LAASIMASAIGRAGESPWVFPSPIDADPIRAKSAMRAVLRLRSGVGLANIGTHDLRRTLATGLGDMGVPDEVIERVLNHAPRTVTGRHYNHAKHFEAMRQALEAWEKHLLAIIDGCELAPNVFALRTG